MKELFREYEFTRVAFFQGLLENEGIAAFIRNQDLSNCAPAGYSIAPPCAPCNQRLPS